MYALPEDFDTELLSGCYLEMVCFGPSITKLDFSRPQMVPGKPAYKVSICVEAGLSYQVGEVFGTRKFADPVTCAPLIGFLLKDVVAVRRIKNASFEVVFDDSSKIMVEADTEADFESYSIYLDSGDVIVV
jgi:hypothetical protein